MPITSFIAESTLSRYGMMKESILGSIFIAILLSTGI